MLPKNTKMTTSKRKTAPAILRIILTMALIPGFALTVKAASPTIRQLEAAVDHNHCTTRQFQHMSFRHEGVWFVFYSDGRNFRYQTSANGGQSWRPATNPVAPAPNGSTSFDVLKVGEEVFISHVHYPLGRYDPKAAYARDPKRRGEYRAEGRVKRGQIEGRNIRWREDVNPGFTPDYGNLVRDSAGDFWIFTRDSGLGVVYRSRDADDISRWSPKAVCLPVQGRHAMDAAALDEGRIFVATVLTTSGRLYGNLFDGTDWSDDPVLLAESMTTVAGDDRRVAMKFDEAAQKLHVIYVDAGNHLRHRLLRAPYQPGDWSPGLERPGRKLADKVFTCALSTDSSQPPPGLVETYGLEKRAGRDQRERTGEIHVQRFDGRDKLGAPLLVSQPRTELNWYPNVNSDARDGLCVMYSRSTKPARPQKPLAVMVSVVPRVPW